MSICDDCQNKIKYMMIDCEHGEGMKSACSLGLPLNYVAKCEAYKPKAIRKDFEPRKQEVLSFGDVPRNAKKGIGLGA